MLRIITASYLLRVGTGNVEGIEKEVETEIEKASTLPPPNPFDDVEKEIEAEIDKGKLRSLDWGPNDHVDIFYGEFLLSRWVLDHAPWNAYHSGLLFTNNSTGVEALFDYCPDDTSSVMRMLVPEISAASKWKAFLLGDVNVTWRNAAHTKQYDKRTDSYTNFVRLGKTNGSVANAFSDWVRLSFAQSHHTFDPLEIVLTNGSLVRSSMCHDFVTDSLWELYSRGVGLKPEAPIFRDHIILYAQAVHSVEPDETPMRFRREFLRYMRVLEMFRAKIAEQFTYGREALIVNWKMGLPIFMRSNGSDVRVDISPPFLNYCYLPLGIPPHVHNPLKGTKLCALAMQANLSNVSVPLHTAVMSPEGRLDRAEAICTVIVVALVAALLPSATKS
jgi:hypothetical protein